MAVAIHVGHVDWSGQGNRWKGKRRGREAQSAVIRPNSKAVVGRADRIDDASTRNVYTQAVSEQKRAAHAQIVGQLLPA